VRRCGCGRGCQRRNARTRRRFLFDFIDGISVVVLTTSVPMPVIEVAKIDPLWFGIYMIVLS
jgi:hypothetical protein